MSRYKSARTLLKVMLKTVTRCGECGTEYDGRPRGKCDECGTCLDCHGHAATDGLDF